MTRIPQGARPKGSQHWLQALANEGQHIFESAVAAKGIDGVQWLSPLARDDYAEYRDDDFLRRLGLTLSRRSLASFWPRRGPVWDGLARTRSGSVLLIEAKANTRELASPPSRAASASAALIARSMDEAKPAFGAPTSACWTDAYYQYANRLAHLYLLRACNSIDAYLVFIYFTGAAEVHGPTAEAEWQEPIHAAHDRLQLGRGPLQPFVIDLFVDVRNSCGWGGIR